ncbi:ADP-ribosylglycohydrolase [Rhodoligotrophos appendicifer]|uniref:ADP-ribosylglycohydrolase family protein n=1 Tax=Rhodoligotrophos appendicifer TaxID=987056 RepID=UPI001478131A|nr:ADP-ribosylglycohydrolase family protein [Rhodoligotrophos appendicifer]
MAADILDAPSPLLKLPALERHALACLGFGVIGDAMGTATEFLELDAVEARDEWVSSFTGDGTDDTLMRDLLATAVISTGGYATADDWAREWKRQASVIFGEKADKFFSSILHATDKLRRDYPPRLIAVGTMPSSTSAMSIAPVGIVNSGHPRAAAAQAMELASLIHVTDVAFCQDGAAAVASAIAAALSPGATIDSAIAAALDQIRPWSGAEMRTLITDALALAQDSKDFKAFRAGYHQRFRRPIMCDSRETIPATLALAWLAKGDPWQAVMLAANFGRDADTIGCMVGGICGAVWGLDEASEMKLRLLSVPCLEHQERLARALVEARRAKADAERRALSNSL